MKTHTTRLAHIIRHTNDLLTLQLERPPSFSFHAGQWIMLSVSEDMSARRAFSISSAENAHTIDITIKTTGQFTQALAELTPGTPLHFQGPYGSFTMRWSEGKDLVLIAGGVGVAPLLSIIRTETPRRQRKIWLYYSARDHASAIAREELEALHCAHSNFIPYFLTQTSGEHSKPMRTPYIKKHTANLQNKAFYICGPHRMIEEITQELEREEVPKDSIITEDWDAASQTLSGP